MTSEQLAERIVWECRPFSPSQKAALVKNISEAIDAAVLEAKQEAKDQLDAAKETAHRWVDCHDSRVRERDEARTALLVEAQAHLETMKRLNALIESRDALQEQVDAFRSKERDLS